MDLKQATDDGAMVAPHGYDGARRVRGARLGRFVLRMVGPFSDPLAYLPIFCHCLILSAQYSFVEGGVEYLAISPLFAPVECTEGDHISDRFAPRYEWELSADSAGRVYQARPVRI
jgi:hypothetical protein